MNLTLGQLEAHLGKGVRPLYVLHGDETLLMQEAVDSLRAKARSLGYTERQSFVVQGAHFDWSSVQAACGAMSLFADRQIIEVSIPTGKPGKEGAVALQSLADLQAADENTLLVISLPKLDKATRQTPWFAALEKNAVCVPVDKVELNALPTWIAQRLARNGQNLPGGVVGQEAMRFLVDRVEGNLLAAHQEIQKLALLYPPGEISLAQLERAVLDVARYDVFSLGQAVWSAQVGRARKMLDGLKAEGVAAVLVHFTLAEDVRQLLRVKSDLAAGKPMPLALRDHRVWGAKEKQFESVLPRLSLTQLQQWLQDAHRVDGVVKGLRYPQWPSDPWMALAQWATQMSIASVRK
jgi:DNA polymerase-3 subunit delta